MNTQTSEDLHGIPEAWIPMAIKHPVKVLSTQARLFGKSLHVLGSHDIPNRVNENRKVVFHKDFS